MLLLLAGLLLVISLFPAASPAAPPEGEKAGQMSSGHDHPTAPAGHVHPAAGPAEAVGITERLGDYIPLDLTFTDEDGNPVQLRDLVTGPTIIAPVYYHCPNVCSFLQADLARTLPQIRLQPGSDYRVLSVSFDERETPSAARAARKTYLAAMGQPFPPEAWRFLTGDIEAIRSLTDAAGYHFLRRGDDFLHPVVIFVVSREGRIVRYLHGTRLLPMDLTLSLTEAGEGRVGSTIRKMVSFCFSFDPEKKQYVFNYLRLSATAVLLTAGGFLIFLIATGRKK
jgi:protein SCO1/2